MPSNTPQDHKTSSKTSKRSTRRTTASSATATPIPVPADPVSKYAPNTWIAGGVGSMEDLTVPSGQLCLVRRPGVEGLLKAGVLRNADLLSSLVNEKHVKKGTKKGASPEVDMSSLLGDEKALEEVTRVVDKVVTFVVVQPEIHETPNDVTRRQPGVVYTDMVDLVDKMFIFNFVVGGTRDIARFRGQLDGSVADVEDGSDVSGSTE